MFNSDNQRNHTKRLLGLTLAIIGLMSAVTLMPGPARLASAQAVGPSWSYTGNLNTARFDHTATLLFSGKVLVAGGARSGLTNSAELYDPATGTWSVTGGLNLPRARFTATLLPNGKVLVAGGHTSSSPTPTNTAELYDPATGAWSLTGNMNTPRAWHSATLLRNGKVLIVGGYGSDVLNSSELYDPETGIWTITGSLNQGRFAHTATLLQNGKVLVAGGTDNILFTFTVDEEYGAGLVSAELYDPSTGSWSATGSLNTGRLVHTATLLPNGNVLVAGGGSTEGALLIDMPNTAELYSPTTGTWGYTGNLSPRVYHTATLLPNGQVLVAGGLIYQSTLNGAEIYDPATGNWSSTANLNVPRFLHTATLLSNGNVLAVGGFNGCCSVPPSAELYDAGVNPISNPIDDAQFFVRQHYLDFLNREPEQRGLDDWMNFLNSCPAGDLVCLHEHRLTASADFFSSPEFQLKGYFVFRFYRTAFDRLPTYAEIAPDMLSVTGQTPGEVYQKKADFTNSFVQRPEFVNNFGALSNANYVAALLNRYQLTSITTPESGNPDGTNKVTLSQFELVSRLDATTLTRAQVLRAIADSDEVLAAEFNRAFVAMQYYGYLRRTPEERGYNNWLDYLNAHPTDFREMVRGFVDSVEYRMRFGQP